MNDDDTKRIQFLEGQAAAIGMTLQVLIERTTNNAPLISDIQERAERLQARLLSTRAPDPVREGAQDWVRQWIPKPKSWLDPGA